MLWSEAKERCRQLRGAGESAVPRISEILSLWFDGAPELTKILREKDLSRSQPVQTLAVLDYDAKLDRPVQNSIRGLSAPVTVESVLSMMICQHGGHPAVSALEGCFTCKGTELSSVLRLNAQAPAVAEGNQNTALVSLTTDLSARARAGAFSDLVESPATLALERGLLKARRGSMILTGEQGGGKTASVECLAHRIESGAADPRLRGVRILELNVGSLVAGTQFRGQFTARVDELLKALSEEKGRVVLWIDEIHTVVGAGRVHGDSYDFSNALKTVLADGGIRIVGATTDNEFDRYIMKDPAFARRFERIRLTPVSGSSLHAMVEKQVAGLSKKHEVEVPEAVWLEALSLSDLYLANRSAQPDRVLDLIDSACTLVVPPGCLGTEHLIAALAQNTGVPRDVLERGVTARLSQAAETTRQEVFGQDEVIKRILSRLESNPFRFESELRPLASFLILGSSGVGKTLLARTLSHVLFGPEMFLRIHCGEFSEGGIAKLIGTPLPGIDLQADEAILPGFLRKHPCGVILFDELEKAHGTLWDLLLGLLDCGEIQSGDGRTYSARKCMIICTSNIITSRELAAPGIGFGSVANLDPDRRTLCDRLPLFRKELLNRFDDLLIAAPLAPESQLLILNRHLASAEGAGILLPGEDERAVLLRQHASAIEAEGGRAIERLAADTVAALFRQKHQPLELVS